MDGNTNAKRSARIHSVFNIIGVTWMVLLLPVLLPYLGQFVVNVMGQPDPYTAEGMPIGLSAFHTAFNLTNVLLMLGFVPLLVRVAIWSVPSSGEDDEEGLKFISTTNLTPELAIIEVQKEVARFGEIAARMSDYSQTMLNATKDKKRAKMLKKLDKYEKITDNFELEITEYVSKLADKKMTQKTSQKLRSYLNICNDLERIGDLFFQLSKILERKYEDKVYFIPEQRNELNTMFEKVDHAFKIMIGNISNNHYDSVTIDEAIQAESEINAQRDVMKNFNLSNIGNPEYNVSSGMVFNSMFSVLEKIGDHIINVTEDIVGNVE